MSVSHGLAVNANDRRISVTDTSVYILHIMLRAVCDIVIVVDLPITMMKWINA